MRSTSSQALQSLLLTTFFPYFTKAQQLSATFTVNCNILTFHRTDPIIYPNTISNHVHAVVGGNAFAEYMAPGDPLTSTGTTCDKKLDLSNYWEPLMYHQPTPGVFEAVPISGAAIYYENNVCDYDNKTGGGYCTNGTPWKETVSQPFPDGFRMVAGSPLRREYNESDIAERAINIRCDGQVAYPGFPGKQGIHCNKLRAEVTMPSCWVGGDNVDPPDHSSHVTYPMTTYAGNFNMGMCPSSHPHSLLSLFYEFEYDVSSITDQSDGKLLWAFGDTTGLGLHGDFISGWTNSKALQDTYSTCSDGSTNAGCSQVTALKPGQVNEKSDVELLHPPGDAETGKAIGIGGTIAALPGDHKVPS